MRSNRQRKRPGRLNSAMLLAMSLPAMLLAAALGLAACAAEVPLMPQSREQPSDLPQLRTFPVDGEIRVSWDGVANAASYNLYWSRDPDVAEDRDNAVTGIKGTEYTHKGLKNGAGYYYHVVALDRGGKEIHAYPPIGDIPYKYEARKYGDFMAVMPRLHDTYDSLAGQYLKDPDKGWLIRDFNELSGLTPFKALLIPLKPYEPGGLTDKGYRTVPILTYHQISRIRGSKMAVLQPEFELQMAYLRRNRFEVITLAQLVDFLEFKGQVPERAVVITFDDGWASTYTIALPILRRYGYKATLFVSTDLIGSNRVALSWKQVKALEDSGVVDIQCHTQSHPNLAQPNGRDLKTYLDFLNTEMKGSRDVVKQKIGKDCTYLAYPYGAANHLVVAMAQRAGFRAAFTVDRGPNPFFVTNYRVLRSMVFGEYNLKQFAENLETFSNRVLK